MRLTLCGSLRFEKQFKEMNKRLTLAGHVVYSVACYPSDNDGKDWYSPEQKAVLDTVHLAKIDNSDGIVVLDVDGYIGDSTKREIAHAEKTGKRVWYLYSLFGNDGKRAKLCGYAGCYDPLTPPPCVLCYE